MSDVSVLPPFRVSLSAIRAIEELGGAVRIDLEDGGCCGVTYMPMPWDTTYEPPDAWRRQNGWTGPCQPPAKTSSLLSIRMPTW